MKKQLTLLLVVFCILIAIIPLSFFPAEAMSQEFQAQTAAGESEVTRAEWIQMLVAAFNMTVEEEMAPDNYYNDLTGDEDFYRDILVAVTFGVVDIEEGLSFCPNDPVTREFAAQTLNACLSLRLDADAEYTFAEYEEVSCPDDIQIAINRGWFALQNGAFLPNKTITSSECELMFADVSAILEEKSVDPNYDSTYTYSIDVIEVPNGTEVSVDVDNMVTIADCPVEIQSGDVFVVYFGGIPFPYAAQNIEREDNLTLIHAVELNGEDVFSDIDAQGSVETEFTQFVPYEGTEVEFINEITGERFSDAIEAERSVKNSTATRGVVNIKRSISIKQKVKLSDATSASIDFTLKNPKLEYKLNTSTKTAMVTLTGKKEVSIKVEADVTDAVAKKEIQLLLIGVKGIGGLEVSVVFDLSGSATATWSGNLSESIMFSPYTGITRVQDYKAESFFLELEATFKAGVRVSLGINDFPMDIIAGNVYVEAGAKGSVKTTNYGGNELPRSCVHTAIYLYLEYGATAHVKFGPFKTEASYKAKVWTDKNSPLRVVHHYEDGVEVAQCTRGSTDNNGYYTNSTSNYNSTGWSGGNNGYGVDANGNPALLYTYTVDDENNATITGYTGSSTSLSIPAAIDGHTVVAIGEEAFENRSDFYAVVIPNTVSTVEKWAFSGCTKLQLVVLPNSITSIGTFAFHNCKALKTVTIPESLQSVGSSIAGEGPFAGSGVVIATISEGAITIPEYLFSGANSLQSISIPNTVTSIGKWAFYGCTFLNTIELPPSISYIGAFAFYNCKSISTIVIPESLQSVGSSVAGEGPFAGSGVEAATLSGSRSSIPEYLFSGAICLKSISIPNSVTSIGKWAFYGCTSLNSIELPSGLAYVGTLAFYNCISLKTIVIPESLQSVGSSFAGEGPFQESGVETAIFEGTRTAIPEYIFSGANSLQTIIIPDSVTSIGKWAFYCCYSLNQVNLPARLVSLRGNAFGKCLGLQEITIPKTLQSIGYSIGGGGPFSGSGLKTAYIEAGSPSVLPHLFDGANNLNYVSVPTSISLIGEYAFCGCIKLKHIQIPDSVTSINSYAFASSGLEEIVLSDMVTSMGNYVFYGCSSLSNATLPSKRVNITEGMFKNCVSLNSIVLPSSVEAIQDSAFSGCAALNDILIPDKTTNIKSSAFYNCDSLTTVVLNNGLVSLGSNVFSDCDSLTVITIPDSVKSIGTKLFMNCDQLTDVELGNGIKEIPDQCFYECPALQTISLPYRVSKIGNKAFGNCTGLTEATILRNVTSISSDAFSYPNILTIYGVSGTYAETYAGEIGATFVSIDVPATNVSLNETNLRLAKGASFQLIPSITPINFTDATSWKSNNTSVATVTEDGLVKAVGIGEAIISFVVGNKKATCSVTVVQPVTSISLNKTNLSMNAGETFRLVATVSPSNAENKEIEWSTSDETIAAVDQSGYLTALKKGTATITATAKDGSGTNQKCTVTVRNNLIVVTSADGLQSPHPYEPNCCDIWQYSIPGAEGLSITFSTETSVEDGSDFIVIFTGDGTQVGMYTGTELSGQTIQVSGETVRIQLNSDGSYCEYGFAVTSVVPISYGHVHNYVAVVTPSTCTERGYTTHTCSVCGDSYVDAYTNALGHNYQNGVCTRCGTLNPNLENPFSDVKKSKYFYTPVLWAYFHNPRITGGTGDGKFSPNATCTREQIVTFLWKAYGAPEPQSYDNPFKDVKKSKYYYKAVLWAAEKGITSGVGNGKFGVGQGCTREQAMTFLWVAAGKPGHSQQESAFTDVKKGKYYYNAILWAVENGITSGVGNGKFGVGQTCTRAQIVTFLYALLGK